MAFNVMAPDRIADFVFHVHCCFRLGRSFRLCARGQLAGSQRQAALHALFWPPILQASLAGEELRAVR